MPAKHPLDAPDARQTVIDTVDTGGQLADAARSAGVGLRRLSRYLASHPEFAAEVSAARRRSEVIAHHAPRALPAKASPDAPANFAPDGTGCASLTPTGRSAFLELLGEHARDPQSKGCSKAIDILAQLHLAPEVLALQAEAKRRALEAERAAMSDDDAVQVVFTLPPNGTEASRGPAIAVEVVDDQSCEDRG